MGIFSFLKRKEKTDNSDEINLEAVRSSVSKNFTIDRIDYYYEKALEAYCKLYSTTPEALTQEQSDEIYLYAGNHIGFFLAWVIKHDFVGELHKECDAEAIEDVKTERMSGTQFLIDYCDTKLWGEDIADELIPFVREYYAKQYMGDYIDWVLYELNNLPMEFIGTWEDYHAFEHVIDNAYKEYCEAVKME